MKYELQIGLRYTRAKKRGPRGNRFISFISLISMGGIALGVMALIVVLSVMNGFHHELRTRILGVAAHLQVVADGDLADWSGVEAAVRLDSRILGAAPYVQAQGMLVEDGQVHGVVVRGILPAAEAQVADFQQHMKVGSLEALRPGEFGIVIGADLARSLHAQLGDKLTLIAPQGVVSPLAVLPRLKQFKLVGVFEVGMFEFDSGLALIQMNDAQTLYRMGDRVTGVRLKVADLFEAPQIGRELYRLLPADTYVTDANHTFARFSYNHIGFSTQESRFNKTGGTVDFDPVKHQGAVDVTIDTTSVDTGSDIFNGHIQGADFLDTAKYPVATFKSTAVKFDGDKPVTIEGNLTLKGITKPVTLTVTSFKAMPHPMLKKEALGADATAVIKRSDFNMGKYAPAVSDDVTLTISVEAIKK